MPADRTDTQPPLPSLGDLATAVGGSVGDHATLTGPPAASAAGLPHIPGYEVTGEIARDGMGRVLAARELALEREVAIKVLLPGARADRFVTESKVTAKLPHPNIPPVYALGTLADGSPFLAMKLVRGQTLGDELKAQAEPADDLARWVHAFEGICQAVGFAHSRGVVHRDLKPANVMVGEFGEVQVMDWGLGKELNAVRREVELIADPSFEADDGEGAEARTRAGAVLGTPAYMAPEQARGEPVDARADVFALGGILTAVLTGRPVFAGGSVLDTVRRAAAGDTADALARLAACGADAELVAVATTCLAAEPAGRPTDGRAVAARVAAYRAGVEGRLRQAEQERVVADARTLAERSRQRTVRRFTVGVATVLLAGLIGTGYATSRARHEASLAREAGQLANERAEAETAARGREELAKATAVRSRDASVAAMQFLQHTLSQTYSSVEDQAVDGGNAKFHRLRTALDNASRDVVTMFADQPDIEADLRETIGRAYFSIALYEVAVSHLQAAFEYREKSYSLANSRTQAIGFQLALALQFKGDLAAAESVLRRLFAEQKKSVGIAHKSTKKTIMQLESVLSNINNDIAIKFAAELLSDREATLGGDHNDTISSVGSLSSLSWRLGDSARAELLDRRMLAWYERVHGPDNEVTLNIVGEMATRLCHVGKFANAEHLYLRNLSGRTRTLGLDHYATLSAVTGLASLYWLTGQASRAIPMLEDCLRRQQASGASSDPSGHAKIVTQYYLGACLADVGRASEAIPLLEATCQVGVKRPDESFQLSVEMLLVAYVKAGRSADAIRRANELLTDSRAALELDGPVLGRLEASIGRVVLDIDPEAAESVLRECLAIREKFFPAAWATANAKSLLGAALLLRGKYADAEPLLRDGYTGLVADTRSIPLASRTYILDAVERLMRLARRTDNAADLAKWQAERAKYPPETAPHPRPAKP